MKTNKTDTAATKKIPFDVDKIDVFFMTREEDKLKAICKKNPDLVSLYARDVTSWVVSCDTGKINRVIDTIVIIAPKNMEIPKKLEEGFDELIEKIANKCDFWLNDRQAIMDVYESIEGVMAQFIVDIKYKREYCLECAVKFIHNLHESLSELNAFARQFYGLLYKTRGQMPAVLPPKDKAHLWEIRDGKLQRKEPPVKIEQIHPSPEHIRAISKIINEIKKEEEAKNKGECCCKKDQPKKPCSCKKGKCGCKKDVTKIDFSNKRLSTKFTVAGIKEALTKEINLAGANGSYEYLLKDKRSAEEFTKKIREATGIKKLTYKLTLDGEKPHFTFGLAR